MAEVKVAWVEGGSGMGLLIKACLHLQLNPN